MALAISSSVSLGNILTWLVVIVGLVVSLLTIRSKLYEEEREERRRCEVKLKEANDENTRLIAESETLKLKGDLTPVLNEINDFHHDFTARQKLFQQILETQEQQRGATELAKAEIQSQIVKSEERIVTALELIAEGMRR